MRIFFSKYIFKYALLFYFSLTKIFRLYPNINVQFPLGDTFTVKRELIYYIADFTSYELPMYEYFCNASKNAKIVFDVGAAVGWYSLAAAQRINKNGMVYAFEPSHANSLLVAEHAKLNHLEDKIKIIETLVGNKCSNSVEFYCEDGASSQNSLYERRATKPHICTMITLDSYVKDTGLIPDLIKIDTEGAEMIILEGAMELLEKYHPKIVCSIHPTILHEIGADIAPTLSEIRAMGYHIEQYKDDLFFTYSKC